MSPTAPGRARAALLLIMAATAAGCAASGKPAPRSPADDFGDSPFLSLVPADTPYVMANFKPLPASYANRFASMFELLRVQLLRAPAGSATDLLLAITEEIGTRFDARRAEELGLSVRPRVAFYGLGLYPVYRMEIADGKRLLATLDRIVARTKRTLEKPRERGGHRYWVFAGPGTNAFIVAIGPHAVVGAMVPAAEIDRHLPQVLGIEKPARTLPAAALRDLAQRHGFTAYGVGYVDTGRLAGLALPAGAPPACRTAVAEIAARAPRLAWGNGDLAAPVVEAGAVLELAPDLAADLKGLAVRTPGGGAATTGDVMFAMSAAANVVELRALGGRLGDALAAAASACQSERLAELAAGLSRAATSPLPPQLLGIRGAVLSINKIVMEPGAAPTSADGFAAVWSDDAPALVNLAASALPGIPLSDLRPDGTSREIMPGSMPFPVHAILRPGGVALWAGAGGEKDAQAALAGRPEPAPLLRFYYDYVRFTEFSASLSAQAQGQDESRALLDQMSKIFGTATMDVTVDDRGLVWWFKMNMR